MTWPFASLLPHSHGVILVDPPWRFGTYSETRQIKSAAQHYDLMSLDDIKALPVTDLAAPDAMLVMWATQAQLHHAFAVMDAWGFTYKTARTWAKQSKTGKKWAFGTGYRLRCAAEFYLLGTRGSPEQAVNNIRNLIVAPVREHSRKPEQLHLDLERMFPTARKCELFGRERRAGWDIFGNQADRFEVSPCA